MLKVIATLISNQYDHAVMFVTGRPKSLPLVDNLPNRRECHFLSGIVVFDAPNQIDSFPDVSNRLRSVEIDSLAKTNNRGLEWRVSFRLQTVELTVDILKPVGDFISANGQGTRLVK